MSIAPGPALPCWLCTTWSCLCQIHRRAPAIALRYAQPDLQRTGVQLVGSDGYPPRSECTAILFSSISDCRYWESGRQLPQACRATLSCDSHYNRRTSSLNDRCCTSCASARQVLQHTVTLLA
jgi:hypothetical protein